VSECGLDIHTPLDPASDPRATAESALIMPAMLKHMIDNLGLQVNRRYPAFGGTLFNSLVFMWDQQSTTAGGDMKTFRDFAIASLQHLVAAGADPNLVDEKGSPPLFYALQFALTPGRWKDRRLVSELLRATTGMPVFRGVTGTSLTKALEKGPTAVIAAIQAACRCGDGIITLYRV
jgi:hypothetical protein